MTRPTLAARMSAPPRLALVTLIAAPVLLLGGPAALAQNFGGGGIAGNGFQPPVKGGGVVHKETLPPPPALPGAARHEAVAPSTKAATDMSPNDALFDAINRGDMAAARDSLSRGADLSAHDVLGMTPLELSVDLARNDITFLLLSLRSPASDRDLGPPSAAASAAAAGVPRGHGRSGKTFSLASASEPRLSATVRAVKTPAPADLGPASARYSGEPGTPVPQAGFLGFGSP